MPTIDELYESFMDEKDSFAEDVYDLFGYSGLGLDLSKQEWTQDFAPYLPVWDPITMDLHEKKRELDYLKARNLLDATEEATNRVYRTEMDTLSEDITKQMQKGKAVMGATGLRTGSVEVATEDALAETQRKAKGLGDRLKLTQEEARDKYNEATSDAALSYDKSFRDEKQEFYDRTMAALMRIADVGGMTKCEEGSPNYPDCLNEEPEDLTQCEMIGMVQCQDGTCAESDAACFYNVDGGVIVQNVCTPEQLAEGCDQTEYNVGQNWLGFGGQTYSYCSCGRETDIPALPGQGHEESGFELSGEGDSIFAECDCENHYCNALSPDDCTCICCPELC